MTARRSCRSPAARFGIRREFLEDLGETKSREALAQLGRPLMIFHNPHDTIVSVDKRAADLRGRPPSGLIGTLVLFHAPTAAAAAVVSYRAIQLWVPAIMGGVSLSRLRSVLIPDGVDTAAPAR